MKKKLKEVQRATVMSPVCEWKFWSLKFGILWITILFSWNLKWHIQTRVEQNEMDWCRSLWLLLVNLKAATVDAKIDDKLK